MSSTNQANFKKLSHARGLWAGGAVATSQDLAGLFVARSAELYLAIGGRFGFVMPASTLSRSHYSGFRTGHYKAPMAETCLDIDVPWDLSRIEPDPFPVPCAVVLGERAQLGHASPMAETASLWSGRVDHKQRWSQLAASVAEQVAPLAVDRREARGVYGDLMRQGSNLVPRMLVTVERLPDPPMGLPQGQVLVRSRREAEREPWKSLPSLEHAVERSFVRRVHLGETLMPFRTLTPIDAVVPMKDGAILSLDSFDIDAAPGLEAWWRDAERVWAGNRSANTKMTLSEQLNYQSKLVGQYPPRAFRVIYTGRGSRVAAAVLTNEAVIVDHALYWAQVSSLDEGRYLVGLLNSDVLHDRTQDYYSRGLLGARNIHKAAFGVPVPAFDPTSSLHTDIVTASQTCEDIAALVQLVSSATSVNRVAVRTALERAGAMEALNSAVDSLIPPPDKV